METVDAFADLFRSIPQVNTVRMWGNCVQVFIDSDHYDDALMDKLLDREWDYWQSHDRAEVDCIDYIPSQCLAWYN